MRLAPITRIQVHPLDHPSRNCAMMALLVTKLILQGDRLWARCTPRILKHRMERTVVEQYVTTYSLESLIHTGHKSFGD
jgi:hypothetical protein